LGLINFTRNFSLGLGWVWIVDSLGLRPNHCSSCLTTFESVIVNILNYFIPLKVFIFI